MAIPGWLEQIMSKAKAEIDRSTVQLFRCAPTGIPRAHGTGTLFRIADAHFLITAAHVLHWVEAGDGGIVVGNSSGSMMELAGEIAKRDKSDVAAWRLDSTSVAGLSHKKFLTRSDIRHAELARTEILAFYGYPIEWTTQPVQNSHVAKPVWHVTYERQDASISGPLANYEPSRDILVAGNNSDVVDYEGNDASLPYLQGVSGCGIWSIADTEKASLGWSASGLRLVAVETGTYSAPHNLAKGARWGEVISVLGNNWPDLLPAMALHAPVW